MALTSVRFRYNQRLQTAATNSPPMHRWESNHNAVRILQQALLDIHDVAGRSIYPLPHSMSHGVPDGIYGSDTEKAIAQFQKDYHLDWQDGISGRETLGKLDEIYAQEAPTETRPPEPDQPPPEEVVDARETILSSIRWHHPPARSYAEPGAEVWRYINWLIGYRLAMGAYLLNDATDLEAEQEWADYCRQVTRQFIDPGDQNSGGPAGVQKARHVWRDLITPHTRALLLREGTAREINSRLLDYVADEERRLGTRH